MTIEAEKVIADAARLADVLACGSRDKQADLVREAGRIAYLQGFKAGLTHAVKEATGVPS